MSVRSAIAIVLAAGTALSLVACEPANEPAADAPVDATAPVAEPVAGTPSEPIDATRVVDRAPVAGAAPGFDVKAFAGTFATDGANLQLEPDGTYTLVVHAESADAELTTTGTWTVEGDGAELLLDPDSKDEPDRRYAITSNDALTADASGQVLRRDGA